MKEIIAIIRMSKMQKTKNALAGMGYPSMTANKVLGRGRQKGLYLPQLEINPKKAEWKNKKMRYIPKRMVSVIVSDEGKSEVVKIIIKVNKSGNIGDGKIFICPVEEAIRIRTDEKNDEALQ